MKRINLILISIIAMLLVIEFAMYSQSYTKPKMEVSYDLPKPSNVTVEIIKNKRYVLFEQAHQDQHSIYKDYTTFASLFGQSDSSIVSEDYERIKSLDGFDVLVLLTPNTSYSDEEIDLITDAVSNGMTLIIIGEKNSQNILNKVVLNFGITYNDDYVYDLEQYFEFYKNPIISNFTSGGLTRNVNYVAIYNGCSMDIFYPAKPVALGSSSTESSSGVKKEMNLIAVSALGSGKIFAICDSDIFSNAHIKELDNENLARNLVNWS